ncbi:MAG: SIMPL domain-containing protein [Ahrensia sp.]
MTNTVFKSAAVLAFLAAAVSTPALAQDISEQPFPRIMVSGEGTADVAADMAVLNLTVLRQADTAREALDANNDAMASVLSAMKALGIEDRDLQTSNFDIMPRYRQVRNNSTGEREDPIIIGYTVSNALTVRVRDLAKLGTVLDQSVTLGVNQGGNVRFTNDDPTEALEQARIAAMREAMRKAEVLTETAGIKLGKVLEITEHSDRPRPMAIAEADMMMARSSAAVPVAVGENTYAVTVNVSFALDQ